MTRCAGNPLLFPWRSGLLPLLLWGMLTPGRGGEDDLSFAPPLSPPVSCNNLSLGDPKTGGTFSCIACVRSWRWEAPTPSSTLYLVMETACHSTTDARMALLGPQGTVLWEMRLSPSGKQRLCIPHTPMTGGPCTLLLSGDAPGGLTSFSGSIWINLYDSNGERIALDTSGRP